MVLIVPFLLLLAVGVLSNVEQSRSWRFCCWAWAFDVSPPSPSPKSRLTGGGFGVQLHQQRRSHRKNRLAFHFMDESTTRRSSTTTRTTTALPLALQPQQLGFFEELDVPKQEREERRVIVEKWLGPSSSPSAPKLTPYLDAWEIQKQLLEHQIYRLEHQQQHGVSSPFLTAGGGGSGSGSGFHRSSGVDRVLLLEHEPVYTLGTGSDPDNIRNNTEGIPVVRMDRGGEVTYHGPGQLTVYPVLDLRSYRQDIHWYVRALEEAAIVALRHHGVDAERDDETTGVWVGGHKVAAIGVKCRKWVTQHGLAVNVGAESLRGFSGIVPCGIEGRPVGYLNQFVEQEVSVPEFAASMEAALEQVFAVKLVEEPWP